MNSPDPKNAKPVEKPYEMSDEKGLYPSSSTCLSAPKKFSAGRVAPALNDSHPI